MGSGVVVDVRVSPSISFIKSSKSTSGVATVRRERTALDDAGAGDALGEAVRGMAELVAGASVIIASISVAFVDRDETPTPFALAIVCRSSRVFDSRAERSAEGSIAI